MLHVGIGLEVMVRLKEGLGLDVRVKIELGLRLRASDGSFG